MRPFQAPTLGNSSKTTLVIDREFYTRNISYPVAQATLGKAAIWRDLRVSNLRVSPLQFNPQTRELTVCSEITVKITRISSDSINGTVF